MHNTILYMCVSVCNLLSVSPCCEVRWTLAGGDVCAVLGTCHNTATMLSVVRPQLYKLCTVCRAVELLQQHPVCVQWTVTTSCLCAVDCDSSLSVCGGPVTATCLYAVDCDSNLSVQWTVTASYVQWTVTATCLCAVDCDSNLSTCSGL